VLPADGGDAEAVLAELARAGIDIEALAAALQREGAAAFSRSWKDLLERIAAKCDVLTGTH
jgi:transaldolase